MLPFSLAELFHHASRNHNEGFELPTHTPVLPYESSAYKCYTRFLHLKITYTEIVTTLDSVIRARHSTRNFSRKPSSLKDIGNILHYSASEQKNLSRGEEKEVHKEHNKRVTPSAGGKYPIEIYFLVLQDGELKKGVYHYCVEKNEIEFLWDFSSINHNIDSLFTYPWVKNATYAFILTGVLRRNTTKYLDRGYRYMLLEAGHMGERLNLIPYALGLSSCGLTGLFDENIEKFLDIDRRRESVLYGVVVG